jgi:hypothetical protein
VPPLAGRSEPLQTEIRRPTADERPEDLSRNRSTIPLRELWEVLVRRAAWGSAIGVGDCCWLCLAVLPDCSQTSMRPAPRWRCATAPASSLNLEAAETFGCQFHSFRRHCSWRHLPMFSQRSAGVEGDQRSSSSTRRRVSGEILPPLSRLSSRRSPVKRWLAPARRCPAQAGCWRDSRGSSACRRCRARC